MAAALIQPPPLVQTTSTLGCLDIVFQEATVVKYQKEALVRAVRLRA